MDRRIRPNTNPTSIPLVRLNLVLPFLEELDHRGIDVSPILNDFGLSQDSANNAEFFVPAMVMYKLIEKLAKATGDPYLGIYVGEKLDIVSWPVFADAIADTKTLADFIFRFTKNVSKQASSVQWQLNTDGEYATLGAYRVFEPSICPSQVDGFGVGLFYSIIRHSSGELWEPQDVRITVSNPDAIPPNYRNLNIVQGDWQEYSIRFPMEWLVQPFDSQDFSHRLKKAISYASPPTNLIESVREALKPHLHLSDLTADRAANFCGYDKRALGRKLQAKGTTLAREIANLKKEHAIRQLENNDLPISDIAYSVGFKDASAFTRAFKSWVGMAPRNYRTKHRSH